MMKTRWTGGRLLVVGIALALILAPAVGAQEERQDPQDAAASGRDMLDQSGVANVKQAALLAHGAGERELKRAAKLTEKLSQLEGKKLAETEKNIAKAYQNAQGSFREALGYDPNMIDAYVGLGEAFRATGMHQELLQVATQGLRLDPTNDALFAGWAESLLKLDRLGDSTQIYAKLLETNPAWAAVLMVEMKDWLAEHQADPGEIAPADIERMAVWIAEQEGG